MNVIFHNDDYGLSYGFVEAIKECHLQGVTTSTSIRTNGYAFSYGIGLLKKMPQLGIGLHANITEGPTHLNELANTDGKYRYSFPHYYFALKRGNRELLGHIQKEVEYELQLVLDRGITIDHIDSQDHIHMIPPIFELVCKLARKYNIPSVRITREPGYLATTLKANMQPFINTNIVKWGLLNKFAEQNELTLRKFKLHAPDHFYGVLQTNNMNADAIIAALKNAMRRGEPTIEILSHPAHYDPRDIVYTSKFIHSYATSQNRIVEEQALLSPALKSFILKNKINLVTYKDISS